MKLVTRTKCVLPCHSQTVWVVCSNFVCLEAGHIQTKTWMTSSGKELMAVCYHLKNKKKPWGPPGCRWSIWSVSVLLSSDAYDHSQTLDDTVNVAPWDLSALQPPSLYWFVIFGSLCKMIDLLHLHSGFNSICCIGMTTLSFFLNILSSNVP